MPETKIISEKEGPKLSVLKVTVTMSLQSMSNIVRYAITENGADVKSFNGSGMSFQTNCVTDLWRESSGYCNTGDGVVMAGSTGSCSYPMSMII
jgi:fructose-1-phosphate kinase PfkB-like protein